MLKAHFRVRITKSGQKNAASLHQMSTHKIDYGKESLLEFDSFWNTALKYFRFVQTLFGKPEFLVA